MIKKYIFVAPLFIVIIFNNSLAYEFSGYKKIELITKEQANYLTPENTLASRRSALLSSNLDWADETITYDSMKEEIEDFQTAGIDRSKLFELEKSFKDIYVVDKISYLDSIILIIEALGIDGSIHQIPFPVIKENSLWKFTNKFAEDDILLQYLYYIPPLFDGKGGRPMDVNSFLGYKNPNQAQTQLDLGESSYTVHVYYGRTIDPSTFTAELNRQDVSAWFSPQPLSNEKVELPLQKGRNTLVLSVEGARSDGKRARDTDRLVFIMP